MTTRIIGIALIFVATTIAWLILGGTLFARTYSTDRTLRGRVTSIWGDPQTQLPPAITVGRPIEREVVSQVNGKAVTRIEHDTESVPVPIASSRVNVALDLAHRQKGLLWYSTYGVDFAARYAFTNPDAAERTITFTLTYPSAHAIYDRLVFTLDGRPLAVSNDGTMATATAVVPAGATAQFHVAYRSQGLDAWTYSFGKDVAQVRDFELRMTTNFKAVDFPDNSLAPTTKQATPHGWALTWRYQSLVSGYAIAMAMPERLQPGPLAARISLFAPVSLLFFFFLMFIITTLRGIDLHPMNYFFLAAAFFSFHLLLAYLVDHLSIHVAFVICSVVSIGLVVSYLRLVVGSRFAWLEAGAAQLIYLVAFSYAFFFEGFTGLAVTIGAILTLFIVMQKTARIRWAERFRAPAGIPMPGA
jgi:inner membrane protein involved in colicin E2 resistance